MSSGRRGGASHFRPDLAANAYPPRRNIITHHAEDGSGVGSAIIAGTLLPLIPYSQFNLTFILFQR
jgi:hypothetical protein